MPVSLRQASCLPALVVEEQSFFERRVMTTPDLHWDDRYSVAVQLIDEQHQKLFADLNTLIHLLNTRVELSEVESVVDDLIDYVGYHFSTEEKLLAKHPHYAAHRLRHQEFTEKVRSFDRQLLLDKPEQTAISLFIFLGEWLQNHIQTEDRLYFDYLHRHKLLPTAE